MNEGRKEGRNKLYFSRVVDKTRGLFREREREQEGVGGGDRRGGEEKKEDITAVKLTMSRRVALMAEIL